jgi:hypothetical protein
MSEECRDTVKILMCWPHDHQKTSKQMQEENLMDDSTDVWYDNIVQKCEKLPMESTLLPSAQMHIVCSRIKCIVSLCGF